MLDYYFKHQADNELIDVFLGIHDVDRTVGLVGRTLLHNISSSDCVGIAIELIHRGAAVNVMDVCGVTPLMLSAKYGKFMMASFLLKNQWEKADPMRVDSEFYTALHFACRHDQPIMIPLLRKHGADPDARTLKGYTPLHYCCRNGNSRAALLMLQWYDGNINSVANDGETPLSLAVQAGVWPLVEMLLVRGASILLLDMKKADTLFAMLINERFAPKITLAVFDSILELYTKTLTAKLKSHRVEDVNMVGLEQAQENHEWNAYQYVRSLRLFSVQKLRRMLKNEEPASDELPDKELHQLNWENAQICSRHKTHCRRMTLFVKAYAELVGRGDVRGYDPSFRIFPNY